LGGISEKPIGMYLTVALKKASMIRIPPAHVIAGTLIPFKAQAFLLGGMRENETPIPFVSYDVRGDKWKRQEDPPEQLSLPGGYIQNGVIYAIGGWTDFPVNLAPFQKIARFTIATKTWSTQNVTLNLNLNRGIPKCVVNKD